MKHKKQIKAFYFNKEIDDIIDDLDEIELKKHSDLLDRIYNRYPFLSQIELAIFIKVFFEVLRELLIRGCIINLHRFFFDLKLLFFQHNRSGSKINNAVKIKIKTPPTWKERPSWKAYKKKIKI